MFLHKKKSKVLPLIIGVIILMVLFVGFFIYRFTTDQKVDVTDVKKQDQQISQTKTLLTLASTFLGFTKPQTYLVLFLNNTELRPTGGFIGSYGVITLEKGKVTIHQIEGSENTDWKNKEKVNQLPPAPLTNYLGVPYWYFRDANWSPDFAQSAKKSIELYNQEIINPVQHIDAVVGVTPVVLETFLDMVGDVTIDDITFSADNVIEKLEYEVEYGFEHKNISIKNRKDILQPLLKSVLFKITPLVVTDLSTLLKKIEYLADTKNIQFFSFDDVLQKKMQEFGWSGEVSQKDGDFLMWVDANLGALKTDHAMWRDLQYRLIDNQGELFAEATMKYQHNGVYDWRTSRYRTYSRIFVPLNAQIAEVTFDGSIVDLAKVDRGQELGKQWFGTFISIEPGMSKEVVFRYRLPAQIQQMYQYGQYQLYVQKQAGTSNIGLTIHHSFAKSIVAATPAEQKDAWGDQDYIIQTDLEVDRQFAVSIK